MEPRPERFEQAVRILDRAGVGTGLLLGVGTATRTEGRPSGLEHARTLAERMFPGRFLQSMLLDYSNWDQPGWSNEAVKQIEAGHAQGAAGLKEFKRLGLFLKDGRGNLIVNTSRFSGHLSEFACGLFLVLGVMQKAADT